MLSLVTVKNLTSTIDIFVKMKDLTSTIDISINRAHACIMKKNIFIRVNRSHYLY